MKQRLQKILAQQGIASRRKIEEWLAQGEITLNGKIAKLGDKADEKDLIKIRGRQIKIKPKGESRLLLYHKPEGEICSHKDPQNRPTIFERLPKLDSGRWLNVGRLDVNSSGLLLITNSGALAHRLMHPSYCIEREYAARVFGELTDQQINKLLSGVNLSDGMAKFNRVGSGGGRGKNHWYYVSLSEGRNREVRRIFETQNCKVNRLIRIKYGPIVLPKSLRKGDFIELDPKEVEKELKITAPS